MYSRVGGRALRASDVSVRRLVLSPARPPRIPRPWPVPVPVPLGRVAVLSAARCITFRLPDPHAPLPPTKSTSRGTGHGSRRTRNLLAHFGFPATHRTRTQGRILIPRTTERYAPGLLAGGAGSPSLGEGGNDAPLGPYCPGGAGAGASLRGAGEVSSIGGRADALEDDLRRGGGSLAGVGRGVAGGGSVESGMQPRREDKRGEKTPKPKPQATKTHVQNPKPKLHTTYHEPQHPQHPKRRRVGGGRG
ncbi:hypothetical protein BC628DRAFT_1032984 [Trametes gibbosa]|nr:hypothetical protein BC628DRAFT_1032984 [Trametes gibbosa]